MVYLVDTKSLVYKGLPPDHMCGDTTLRVLPDGAWCAFFVTGGATEPDKANHIVACDSTDQGRTWGPVRTILAYTYKACLFSEVIVDGDLITMFVQTHGGMFDHWRVGTITSTDNGRTWSDLVPFDPLPHRAFIRNLYKDDSRGVWVLPIQAYLAGEEYWQASPHEDDGGLRAFSGSLVSTDAGASWVRSNLIGPTNGWPENNVVGLADGSLAMLIRADGTGGLLRSDSLDMGATWSVPYSSGIPNPGTKFRLFKLRDGRIVLVHNPSSATRDPNSKVQAHVNRNPLALWVSSDDMQSWGHKRVLTDFPGMLAYPDGFISDDERYVHFIFDYNRHDVIYWGAELPLNGAVS